MSPYELCLISVQKRKRVVLCWRVFISIRSCSMPAKFLFSSKPSVPKYLFITNFLWHPVYCQLKWWHPTNHQAETYNLKTPKMHKKLSHTFPIIFHILQPLTRNLPPFGEQRKKTHQGLVAKITTFFIWLLFCLRFST